MSKCRCFRWAFKIVCWEPESAAEWFVAVQSIQAEESVAASRFLFREDQKAKVIGRLMLRQAARRLVKMSEGGCDATWKDLVFGRTEKGKPHLKMPALCEDFGLNISHHGDWVVLASSCSKFCGVDVMKIELPTGKRSVKEYLDLMARQISAGENSYIRNFQDEWTQMTAFYRIWCLKESYIKAIGSGIHNKLSSLDFYIKSPFSDDSVVSDTTLKVFGENTESVWKFEEVMLDGSHCVAVCSRAADLNNCDNSPRRFREMKFSELLDGAEPVQEELNMGMEWSTYQTKTYKTRHQ